MEDLDFRAVGEIVPGKGSYLGMQTMYCRSMKGSLPTFTCGKLPDDDGSWAMYDDASDDDDDDDETNKNPKTNESMPGELRV